MTTTSATSGLATTLRGDLIDPSDPRYDDARQIWNGMIDKRPALIAQCSGTADVVAAVKGARDAGLTVAVRGGGHNVAGNALNDDGLVIDLSRIRGISVDPQARTARVQPGADWGDLDRETQLHGLATPGGMASQTGVAGFTLGGGMGFLRRKWGLACDNLVSAEVVTADGRVLTASETEHADLFWAIRGGGGNFGVVTSFEFQLHRLGPEIYAAMVVYPADQTASVARAWRDYLSQAPDEVTCDLAITGMPPLPPVPPEMHWAPVAIAFAVYAGPVQQGEAVLQPVRELGTPVADMSGPQPYVAIQSALDAAFPNGLRYYWKSFSGSRLSDEFADALAALCAGRPTPQTLVGLRSLGGAMGRIPEEATAYANRGAHFNLSIDATWQDPADDERIVAWVRQGWASMRELTDASDYVNFAGLGEENDRLAQSAYGRNFDRLRAIKRKYDPDNLFHGNVNIAP
jgi:FAD/FMN-containing dehydrogenase